MCELSSDEKDAIGEVGNIAMGAASTALSNILDKKVVVTTPRVNLVTVKEIKKQYPASFLHVEVEYTSGLQGKNVLLLKEEDALLIAGVMMGELFGSSDGTLGEMELSAVREAMNQMMGFAATAMSEMFQRKIDISPPKVEFRNLSADGAELDDLSESDRVVQVQFSVSVEGVLDSTLIQIIPVGFARDMVRYLISGEGLQDEEEEAANPEKVSGAAAGKGTTVPGSSPEQGSRPKDDPAGTWSDIDLQKLALIKDIQVNLTVILGQTRLPLGKLFALGKGGLLDLDNHDGEPVEILANGRPVAKGEVVSINGRIGVRVTTLETANSGTDRYKEDNEAD